MIWRTALVLIFLSANLLMAQDSVTNNILTTKKFRYGIFGNPNEFRQNNPSVTSGFRIEIDSGKFQGHKLYQWILRYDNGKKVRRAYAFSDGVNLFVNARTFDLTTDYFIPVIILGPIVYFEDYLGRMEAENRSMGLTPIIISRHVSKAIAQDNPGWFIYLSDDDGSAYTLDRQSVGSVLKQDDQELYDKYKNDKRPKDNIVLKEYLIEFNRRKLITVSLNEK